MPPLYEIQKQKCEFRYRGVDRRMPLSRELLSINTLKCNVMDEDFLTIRIRQSCPKDHNGHGLLGQDYRILIVKKSIL